MNEIEEIYTKFSNWVCLTDRNVFSEKLSLPGVYLVARNTLELSPSLRPSVDDHLFYVGETCDQSLGKRLYQFHRSAFVGKPAHSGGTRFYDKFEELAGWALEEKKLMIAILPIAADMQAPQLSAYIRYVERAIIWNHVKKFNGAPMFNAK